MSARFTLWLVVVLTVLALWVNLPPLPNFNPNLQFFGKQLKLVDIFPLKLGLDLQGGTQLILQAEMDQISLENRDEALGAVRRVIEKRVNLYGVSEAVVQTSKYGEQRRVLVELPGVKDTQTAVNLVGKTAQLEFREIDQEAAAKLREELATESAEATTSAATSYIDLLSAKPTGITGADLKKAQVVFGQSRSDSGPQVQVQFTPEGTTKFAEVTRRNIGKQLPIFLDGQPISSPVVNQEIVGDAIISGGFDLEQAKSLAIQLNAGALPVPVKIIEQRLIGASLGDETVKRSLLAGVIGIVSIMVFMVLYYGWMGVVACLGLITYSLLTLAVFRTGFFKILPPVTLTLAGIAGFILSIGMAVDANILTFERMKEELRAGKGKSLALNLGFSRAWSSIRDSNVSSLITATILYSFGTSVVRGFAVTLFIGVLISMFSALTVTRMLLRLFIK